MEELEVYREKQGIVPRESNTAVTAVGLKEIEALRTVRSTEFVSKRQFATTEDGYSPEQKRMVRIDPIKEVDNQQAREYTGDVETVGKAKNRRDVRRAQLRENVARGRTFENMMTALLKKKRMYGESQITIITFHGVRIRVDLIGYDIATKEMVIDEFKSSKTARLTRNQTVGFDDIASYGGTVVGKGKGRFRQGVSIPAGTKVYIHRPE